MPPKLELCFTLRGMFDKPNILDVKSVKGGPQRNVVPINKGFLRGSGVEADVIPGSGDWFLLNPETNTLHLDVRFSARTKQGHAVFMHYDGVMKMDEKSTAALVGASGAKSTEYGDHEWFVTPIMETSDPELKWIESSVWVGEGRWIVEGEDTGIEYEVYRVRPSR